MAFVDQLSEPRLDEAAVVLRRPEDRTFVPSHVNHYINTLLQEQVKSHHLPFKQNVKQRFEQFRPAYLPAVDVIDPAQPHSRIAERAPAAAYRSQEHTSELQS